MLTSITASVGVRVRPPMGGQTPCLFGRCGAAACLLVGLRETNTVIPMLRAGEAAVQRDLGQKRILPAGRGLQHRGCITSPFGPISPGQSSPIQGKAEVTVDSDF